MKKGINFLIDAAEILREELKEYKIVVAGEGESDYVSSLKQQIKDKGLQKILQFIGGVYGELLISLYCQHIPKISDLLLLKLWLQALLSLLQLAHLGVISMIFMLGNGLRLVHCRWLKHCVSSWV